MLRDIQIEDRGKILLSFSGGEDSLALASLLSKKARERTALFYVNHRVRSDKELKEEEERNKENASLLSLPLVIKRLSKEDIEKGKGGQESVLRKLRYSLLFSYALEKGFSYIYTAHHKDDQVETVLMRILEGSPFYSWQGIKERDALLRRPLLHVSKEEIREYLRSENLAPSYDSTNLNLSHKRNYIRHKIIPFLSEREKELIVNISKNVREFSENFSPYIFRGDFVKKGEREKILSLSVIEKERTLYSLKLFDERMKRGFVKEIDKFLLLGRGRIITKKAELRFSKHFVTVYPLIEDFKVQYMGGSLKMGNLILKEEKEDDKTLLFSPKDLTFPLTVRKSGRGDRIELKDGFKTVKGLEKDWKIPYSIVIEDGQGIVAVFARFLGAKDRISKRFITSLTGDEIPLSISFFKE